MSNQIPVFLPLAGAPKTVEVPVDTTVFVDLTEDEERLPRTTSVRKNFSLRGRVDQRLLYPFTFSSNTLTLGYLWSSYTPTAYTGIGIRHNAELSDEENRLGIAVYHYVLDEITFVEVLNKTAAFCGQRRQTADQWKEGIRLLTGNCLVLLLCLKQMRARPEYKTVESFPLESAKHSLKLFLCGFWEELWAVAHQMAAEPAAKFSTAALVRACAAYYYYSEASKTADCSLVTEQTLAVAKNRVRCVLIGWIVERISESRKLDARGLPQKWADIPWPVEGTTQLSTGKYRAAVFSALDVVKNGKPVPPPSDQYAEVFRKAVLQCETNLIAMHKSVMGVRTSGRTFSSSPPVDPYAVCHGIGAAWAAGTDTALLAKVAHQKPHSAWAVWGWTSETAACPAGLEVFYEEGRKRYANE